MVDRRGPGLILMGPNDGADAEIQVEDLIDLEYCPLSNHTGGSAWFDGELLHIHAIGKRYRYRVSRRRCAWRSGHFPMERIDGGIQVHG